MSTKEDNVRNGRIVELIANTISAYEDQLPEIIEFINDVSASAEKPTSV
ncbi:hypothetical protein [Parashewanella tropica]|nr:hypothetical protein [Parashewanella tropica]